MFATRLTKLSRAFLAGAVLLILACLLMSVTLARAETEKGQIVATSLAQVSLEPEAKLLVILGNGEKVKGKATDISDRDLSVSTKDGVRIFSESEIFQISQVKGRSRARGALYGAGIGTAGTLAMFLAAAREYPQFKEALFACVATVFIPSGMVIGALVSGEKYELFYQNTTISIPSDSKTGLINFRDGRLSFAAPSIYLRPNRFDGFQAKPFKRTTKHIELVRVDF